MLSVPAPAHADVSAAGYYRPDKRFSPQTNANRIELAQQRATNAPNGYALALEFDRTWRHQPWLTPAAAQVLTGLLLDGRHDPIGKEFGWDHITFLRKATGRRPLTTEETRYLQQHGIRWLALG